MRKFSAILPAILIASCLSLPACATLGAGTTAGSGSGITVTDAITQAQGAASAIVELTKTSPLDDKTKSQIEGYSAWVDFALRAAGIVAAVVTGS